MTHMKYKKSNSPWIEPALWLKAGHINFKSFVVRINKKTYTVYSRKFAKAYEDDRLLRTLMQ